MISIERVIGRTLANRLAGEAKAGCHKFPAAPSFELESAFSQRGLMMAPYLGHGHYRNVSPPLTWSDLPAGTASLALLIEDYDVPIPAPAVHGLAHWPAGALVALPEGALSGATPTGVVVGRNIMGMNKYLGPLPIRGHGPHHYLFQLFALSQTPALKSGFARKDLLAKMAGRVLGIGTLTGIYERI